jgi:hypothetical protein
LPRDVPTDYASAPYTPGGGEVGYVNAMQWYVGVQLYDGTGMLSKAYKISADVDFEFVNGVTSVIMFQWLGPLIAVGLAEMPKLARELFRRSGIRLHPHELRAAWMEMRQDRRRVIFA